MAKVKQELFSFADIAAELSDIGTPGMLPRRGPKRDQSAERFVRVGVSQGGLLSADGTCIGLLERGEVAELGYVPGTTLRMDNLKDPRVVDELGFLQSFLPAFRVAGEESASKVVTGFGHVCYSPSLVDFLGERRARFVARLEESLKPAGCSVLGAIPAYVAHLTHAKFHSYINSKWALTPFTTEVGELDKAVFVGRAWLVQAAIEGKEVPAVITVTDDGLFVCSYWCQHAVSTAAEAGNANQYNINANTSTLLEWLLGSAIQRVIPERLVKYHQQGEPDDTLPGSINDRDYLALLLACNNPGEAPGAVGVKVESLAAAAKAVPKGETHYLLWWEQAGGYYHRAIAPITRQGCDFKKSVPLPRECDVKQGRSARLWWLRRFDDKDEAVLATTAGKLVLRLLRPTPEADTLLSYARMAQLVRHEVEAGMP